MPTFQACAREMERDIHRLVHAVVPFARREQEFRPGDFRTPHPSGERESVGDPGLGARPEADPFDYRSVPYRRQEVVRAKIISSGPIRPSPIDDDLNGAAGTGRDALLPNPWDSA